MAVPPDIVKCSNCSAKFKVSKAKEQSMAKVQIKDNNGEMHKITMFTTILSTLLNTAQPRETIEEYLLSMDNIKVQINSSNIVTAVDNDD
uniref:Replication factor A C-terminal domain-containing protein n=1 Tax=Amphimedon queenslandica TaxID=400682 RepID=A0A1X7U490_AMPQE